MSRLLPFFNYSKSSSTSCIPISINPESISELDFLSQTIYHNDSLKQASMLENLGRLVVKAIGLVCFGIFNISFNGLKIGITERETVLESSIGNSAAVYGYFKVVLDRFQGRLSIEKMEFLSMKFKDFVSKMNSEFIKDSIVMTGYGVAFMISFTILFYRLHNRTYRIWLKNYYKAFGPINKNQNLKKIYYQKKLMCENCKTLPADIWFNNCGHLIYCIDCFKEICQGEFDLSNGKCSQIKCLDCEQIVDGFKKIVYS